MDTTISLTDEKRQSDVRICEADYKEEVQMNNSMLKGIGSGAVIRPEPLFHRRTRIIIDTHYSAEHNLLRNGLEETEFESIKLISLDKLFDNKNEVFLGFGLPNVYLTIPNEQYEAYVKFAAFILWRQVSAIVPTKGRVQSGFLIRLRDLSHDVIETIRQSMIKHSNQRNVSCAYASACVLNTSGITSGGSDLRNHFGARALFQQIFENGLEFQGTSLTLDFIRTTRLTLEEHFHQVRRKELTSLVRTCKKVINECSSSADKKRAPLLEVNDIPTRVIIKSDINSFIRLQISRPRRFGAVIRKIWGSHTLFKVIPKREKIDINNYLPETLRAFPSDNPDFFTRMKKYFLFSRFVVMRIRNEMATLWDDHGEFSSVSLASMMSIHTKHEPHPYNIVITGNHLIGMHDNLFFKSKLVHWVLSKHVLISGYDDDVRFAGEAWMEHEENGLTIHITNNSGTYQPSNQHLDQTARFISDAFPGLHVQTHRDLNPISPPLSSSSSHLIDQQDSNVFTIKNLLIIVFAFLFWLCFVLFGSFH